jgi:recombination protein RecA
MDRDKLLREMRKKFGTVVPEVGEQPAPTEFLSSGILSVDYALNGGFPRGHISHIWGGNGGGKTTMMAPLMISATKNPSYNGVTLYFATEPKIDERYFYNFGVDPDKVIFMKTSDRDNILDGNRVCNMTREYMGEADLIIWDSVAGMAPLVAYETEAEKTIMASVSRLLSLQLNIIASTLAGTKTALVLLNQERKNFDQFTSKYFPTIAYSGAALGHWVANRCHIKNFGPIKQRGITIGFKSKLNVEKNDFGPPKRVAQWNVIWETGIDTIQESFEFAKQIGLLKTASGYYKLMPEELPLNYPGNSGAEDALARLRAEPELLAALQAAVMASQAETESDD